MDPAGLGPGPPRVPHPSALLRPSPLSHRAGRPTAGTRVLAVELSGARSILLCAVMGACGLQDPAGDRIDRIRRLAVAASRSLAPFYAQGVCQRGPLPKHAALRRHCAVPLSFVPVALSLPWSTLDYIHWARFIHSGRWFCQFVSNPKQGWLAIGNNFPFMMLS